MDLVNNAVSDACLGVETDNNNRDEPVSAWQWEKLQELMLYAEAVLNVPLDMAHHPTHFRAAQPRGRKNDIPVAGYDVDQLLRVTRARKGQPIPSGKLVTGVHKIKENGTNVRSEASDRGGRSTVRFQLSAGTQVFVRRVVPDLGGETHKGFNEWGEIEAGWFVHGSLLVRSADQFKLQAGNHTVSATDGANVRSEPSTKGGDSTIKYKLPFGRPVTVREPVFDLDRTKFISGSNEWGRLSDGFFIHASTLRREVASVKSVGMFAVALQQANQRFRSADQDAAMAHFGEVAIGEALALCFEDHRDLE